MRTILVALLVWFAVGGFNLAMADPLLPDSCDNILPGDVNGDGFRHYDDAVALKWFLCYGGTAPDPLANGDANGDCIIDWQDVDYIYWTLRQLGEFTLECTCVNPEIGECPENCADQYPGDANYDGFINTGDAVYIGNLRYSQEQYLPPNVDLNGDCVFDYTDYNWAMGMCIMGPCINALCTCDEILNMFYDSCETQFPGDINGDGYIFRTDLPYLIDYFTAGGPAPDPLSNGDVNGDCIIDGNDINYLYEYLVLDGAPPVTCTCLNPEIGEFFADSCVLQMPGDANGDGNTNVGDAIYILDFFCGGPPPDPLANGDWNGDCIIDSTDIMLMGQPRPKNGQAYLEPEPPVVCTCQEPVIGDYFQDPCFGSLPGDANGDGIINIADVVYIVNYVFRDGPESTPYAFFSGDANCDCEVNIGDAVYIINFVFRGGDPPCDCETWHSNCPDQCGRITLEWLILHYNLYIE